MADSSISSLAQEIATALVQVPMVQAVALSGSHASDAADCDSDLDLYVFTSAPLDHATRRQIALAFDPDPAIGLSWFGEGDEWMDFETGQAIDLIYLDTRQFEADLRRVIEHHQPSVGYSTAFWHTIRRAQPVFDRNGWFAGIQSLADIEYPEALQVAIVNYNRPLLRSSQFSFLHQIELAIKRDDPASVNHRVAALIASVIDIAFAVHAIPHPGEKRILPAIAALGETELADRLRELLSVPAEPVTGDIITNADAVCDATDAMLTRHGLGVRSTSI